MNIHTPEHYLIGAMLQNNDLIEQITNIVSPEDIDDAICRELMCLIVAVRAKGLKPDVISLSEEKTTLNEGTHTITATAEIQRNNVTWQNWEAMSHNVKDASLKRKYHQTLRSLLSTKSDDSAPVQIANAQDQLARLIDTSKTSCVRSLAECMPALIEDIRTRMEAGGAVNGLLAGYEALDHLLGGMRGGHMIVIAGRPGTGKTTLAMNILENLAHSNTHSLVFSLEMSAMELTRRMLGSVGKIPLSAIDTGQIADHSAKPPAGVQRIKDMPVFVCDRAGIGMNQIRSIAAFQKRSNQIGIIVIDYIGLIKTSGNRTSNRTQELGEISRQCKEMAKALDIPVIILAQLNREIDKSNRDAYCLISVTQGK